jgi:hypothetical protein
MRQENTTNSLIESLNKTLVEIQNCNGNRPYNYYSAYKLHLITAGIEVIEEQIDTSGSKGLLENLLNKYRQLRDRETLSQKRSNETK